ncbi:MAG: calcium/sodium antiporter [Rhizobiaceae bacterium]
MNLLFILAGLALLFAGGEGLVRGAVAIAERLGLSKLVIGLTIVGMGTSFPELLVSARAALAGSPDIAVANVVGSNFANILVILGFTAFMTRIEGWDANIRRDTVFGVFAGMAVMLLGFYGEVPRLAGLAMVLMLVGYLYTAYRMGKIEPTTVAEHFEEAAPHPSSLGVSAAFVAVGFAALFIGAEMLVRGAVALARDAGISERIIGLTIVAIGTSLPELAASIAAALRGHPDVALGNVAGSNLFNILGILGLTAVVSPVAIAPAIAAVDLPLMVVAMIGLAIMMYRLEILTRRTGAIMLGLYGLYLAVVIVT